MQFKGKGYKRQQCKKIYCCLKDSSVLAENASSKIDISTPLYIATTVDNRKLRSWQLFLSLPTLCTYGSMKCTNNVAKHPKIDNERPMYVIMLKASSCSFGIC